jgi:hypothetical protein
VACACAAPGAPCDCDDADPSTFPGAPEPCDAPKDRDCNGVVGQRCADGRGCAHGMCAPVCIPLDDFGCRPFAVCEDNGSQRLCVGRDCTVYGCPPGSTCDDSRSCVPSCNPAVRCPFGAICRGLGCVDPCLDVTCAPGTTCDRGRCVGPCDCPGASCEPGRACDVTQPVPRCVEQGCVGVTCPGGQHCAAGACVDDCAGVVCPPDRVCRIVAGEDAGGPRGQCVDLCPEGRCPLPRTCDWRTGACLEPTFPEAGLRPVGERDASDAGAVYGGGGCSLGGLGSVSVTGACLSGLAFALALARRARRRRAR